MSPAKLRVIKLGGSLLDWPELADAFDRWLTRQPAMANIVIAGGGQIVEALRRIDRAHSLAAEHAHWLAIRGMDLTARAVARVLRNATLVERLDQLRRSESVAPQIFLAEAFLREDQHRDALPCSWDVTSDSIAAHVARELAAIELVLLKSALPGGPADPRNWAESGFVDRYFPRAAEAVSVRAVNLREDDFPERVCI